MSANTSVTVQLPPEYAKVHRGEAVPEPVRVWLIDVIDDRVIHVFERVGNYTTTNSFADRQSDGEIWRVTITSGSQLTTDGYLPHNLDFRAADSDYKLLMRRLINRQVRQLLDPEPRAAAAGVTA